MSASPSLATSWPNSGVAAEEPGLGRKYRTPASSALRLLRRVPVPLAPGGVLLDVLVSISVSSKDQKLLSPACCRTQSLFSPSMGRSQYSPISNPLGFCSDLFSTARRT